MIPVFLWKRGRHDRLGENVLEIDGLHDLQRNLPVNAAVGHIVDHVPERRNILAFAGVHTDGKKVVLSGLQTAGQLNGKRGISAAVSADTRSVQIDFRAVPCGADVQQNALSGPAFRRGNQMAVTAHHLIQAFIEIMIGQFFAGMRKTHFQKAVSAVRTGAESFAPFGCEQPVIVEIDTGHGMILRFG